LIILRPGFTETNQIAPVSSLTGDINPKISHWKN